MKKSKMKTDGDSRDPKQHQGTEGHRPSPIEGPADKAGGGIQNINKSNIINKPSAQQLPKSHQEKERSSTPAGEVGGRGNITNAPKVSKETNHTNDKQKHENQTSNLKKANKEVTPAPATPPKDDLDKLRVPTVAGGGDDRKSIHDMETLSRHRDDENPSQQFDDDSLSQDAAESLTELAKDGQVRQASKQGKESIRNRQGYQEQRDFLVESSKINYQNSNQQAQLRVKNKNIMRKQQESHRSNSRQSDSQNNSSQDHNQESSSPSSDDLDESYMSEDEKKQVEDPRAQANPTRGRRGNRWQPDKQQHDELDQTKAGSSNEVRDTHIPSSKKNEGVVQAEGVKVIPSHKGKQLKHAININEGEDQQSKFKRSMTKTAEALSGRGSEGIQEQSQEQPRRRRMTQVTAQTFGFQNQNVQKPQMQNIVTTQNSNSPFGGSKTRPNNVIIIENLEVNSLFKSTPGDNSQYSGASPDLKNYKAASFSNAAEAQQNSQARNSSLFGVPLHGSSHPQSTSNGGRSRSQNAKQLDNRNQNQNELSPDQMERLRRKRVASFVKLRTEIFKVTSSQNSAPEKRDQQSLMSQLNQSLGQGSSSHHGGGGGSGSHGIFGSGPSDKKYKRQVNAFHSITFGDKIESRKSMKEGNKVRTQRYTMFSWAPHSLFIQFKRVSNIYFLVISILTFLSFSPKNPMSMIATFVFVLIFTMIKEAYEDYQRYKSDKEMNNKLTKVLNPSNMQWEVKKWQFLAAGDIIRLDCDFEAPADIVLLHCSNRTGIVFVDTMNLDGETNLKERLALHEHLDEKKLNFIQGEIKCDPPNENLERWESHITYRSQIFKQQSANIKNLLLRGCFLRNTESVIGIVVYTGMDTKIMKNLKKPLYKMSNIMRLMNRMLYSVFAFQIILIAVFAGLDVKWINDNQLKHFYLNLDQSENSAKIFFTQLLVFWVAYSHMIPISLYVVIEILKLGQASFINKDIQMFDIETQTYSQSRNSDLVEELGQVEMVFSDKTGTLTQNKMIFKKCQINGVKYGELKPNERDNLEGMAVSGTKEIRERLRVEQKHEKLKQAKNAAEPQKEQATPPPVSSVDLHYVTMFFQSLALCNTVMCDFDTTGRRGGGEIIYKAASPDELALVQGAKVAAIQLVSREYSRVTIYNSATKETQVFKVVAEFPFDTIRKRMSVIVKEIATKQYKILCKGADSVMMERIVFEKNGIDGLAQIVEEDLYTYAVEGLRTLIISSRSIQKDEYIKFKKVYKQVQAQIGPTKEQTLMQIYDSMEQNLRYIGCSAIEDKLQEGVSVTIAKLMQADIRFFMLTGDKLETAIEIARSCQIIQEQMYVLILGQKNRDVIYRRMYKISQKREVDLNEKIYSLKDVDLFNQVIAVEGSTLSLIIEDQELQDLFFHIAIRSKSVVCCRMSPKQKADLVNIFKSRGPWITLAIGDGANDVSMIMEAHIGVGIKGKEGTSAVRSADFAISQFQFLLRLLIFQGRNGYTRVSSMICYYFYKNIVLVLTEFYFALFNGFSGQIFFLDWLPMLYNAVFTSWHCLFTLLLEKDVNFNYSFRFPEIYKSGQLCYYFNYGVFWRWILLGLWHGAVCFYLPMCNAWRASNVEGTRNDHWVASTISFSMIIHLVTYKLLLETRHFNLISFMFGIMCLVIYWSFLLFAQVQIVATSVQPQIQGVIYQMFWSADFWIMMIAGPLVSLIPDVFIQLIKQVFYPTPIDKVLLVQKFKEPNYDYIEHFNNIQKSLQMRKRRTAIQSEQRKIMIAQKKSSFSKMMMERNSSQVSLQNEEQLLQELEPDLLKQSKRKKAETLKNSGEINGKEPSSNQPKSALKKPSETGEKKKTADVNKVQQQKEQDGFSGWGTTNQLNLDASMRSDRPLINSKRDESSKMPERIKDRTIKAPNGKAELNKPKDPKITIIKEHAIPVTTQNQKKSIGKQGIKVAPMNETPDPSSRLQPNQISFNIAQNKESSHNEISSASSFSGNQSQKVLSPKTKNRPNEYKQDVIETPRGSIKGPSPSKTSPQQILGANQFKQSSEMFSEKPNNIQEDTPVHSPKVATVHDQLSPQNQNASPINLDFFKKIVGNRAPNFFLISNNNTIPRNAHDYLASQIQDLEPTMYNAKAQKDKFKDKRERGTLNRLRTPTFPEGTSDLNAKNTVENAAAIQEFNFEERIEAQLRVIDAEEGSKSHPLEKQHRPSTRSKKKKYVEKYSRGVANAQEE